MGEESAEIQPGVIERNRHAIRVEVRVVIRAGAADQALVVIPRDVEIDAI